MSGLSFSSGRLLFTLGGLLGFWPIPLCECWATYFGFRFVVPILSKSSFLGHRANGMGLQGFLFQILGFLKSHLPGVWKQVQPLRHCQVHETSWPRQSGWGRGWTASVCPTPELLNPDNLRNCTVASCHTSGAWQAVAGRVSGAIGHSLLQASGFIGSGLPGSFVPVLMFLMVRVARGILRFIRENIQGFRRLPPNKSFQGTPLRYAPELSR